MQMGFVKMHGCGATIIFMWTAFPAPRLRRTPRHRPAPAPVLPAIRALGRTVSFCFCPVKGRTRVCACSMQTALRAPVCGNGVRCAGALLMARGLTAQSGRAMVRTNSGVRAVARAQGGLYTVEMGAPEWRAEEMGLAGLRGRVLGLPAGI